MMSCKRRHADTLPSKRGDFLLRSIEIMLNRPESWSIIYLRRWESFAALLFAPETEEHAHEDFHGQDSHPKHKPDGQPAIGLVLSPVATQTRAHRSSPSSSAGGRDSLLPPHQVQEDDAAGTRVGHRSNVSRLFVRQIRARGFESPGPVCSWCERNCAVRRPISNHRGGSFGAVTRSYRCR